MICKIFIFLVLIMEFVIAVNDEVKNNIQELETQKNDLYKQIQKAIDRSVSSLLKANDSEATLGLQYMRDLKKHIKELNRTEKESHEEKDIEIDSKSDLENRRSYKGMKYLIKRPKNPFDFETILKPNKISGKEWNEMIVNRNKMQQKLDMWIIERQKEKERRKQHKMEKKKLEMSGKYERCPRTGLYGRKKNEARKRSRKCVTEVDATTGQRYQKCYMPPESAEGRGKISKKESSQYKYPCCRKCCKKSYMGCL
ncbi:uncharacterized protein LOC128198980 [Bicyclus anynana]|uniref:Uncharacterized protein LOC128198980 n=1 Tax=Bicyclus anynana TaxID=110368 RepID=A0ABM3LVH2_BICAN|nr:uncharacterized protein LOC128198980 [Bicyclus anynana]